MRYYLKMFVFSFITLVKMGFHGIWHLPGQLRPTLGWCDDDEEEEEEGNSSKLTPPLHPISPELTLRLYFHSLHALPLPGPLHRWWAAKKREWKNKKVNVKQPRVAQREPWLNATQFLTIRSARTSSATRALRHLGQGAACRHADIIRS